MEAMKKKFGELRRRIGGRILMRSKVSGEIRIVGEKDKREEASGGGGSGEVGGGGQSK